MDIETKSGWIYAVRELEKRIQDAGGGEVTSDSIVDATVVGKSVLTAGTQEAARDAIGAGTSDLVIGTTASTAKAGNYTPAVNDIVGATDVGKSVLTAATVAAARTAIGAGTGNSNLAIGTTATTAMAGNTPIPAAATWDNLSGKPATFPPTIGTTASTAKAGNYTPTVDEISDATAVGKSVLTSATAAAARTVIGAGTSNLAIGTTASTAKAGNYTPTTSEVSTSLKAKAEIAALTEIADPATATAEDVATAVNAIIAALKA